MAGTLALGAAFADSGSVSTPAITDFSVTLRRTRSRELLGVRASKAIVPVRPSASVATGGSFVMIEPACAAQAAETAINRAKTNEETDRPGGMVKRSDLIGALAGAHLEARRGDCLPRDAHAVDGGHKIAVARADDVDA